MTQSKPAAIIFDLGKVLLDFDYSIAARRIAARSRGPIDIGRFFVDHTPLLFRYELGLISTPEFFQEIRAITGFDGTREEFGEFFGDIFTPIQPMVELHATLRKRGYRTYVFSNTNHLAIEIVRRRYPFFGNFDDYIFSYEHGAMKPDSKLYEVVEERSGCRGTSVVYMDDRPENVAAGAARGWRAILHEEPARTRGALEAFGVLTSPESEGAATYRRSPPEAKAEE